MDLSDGLNLGYRNGEPEVVCIVANDTQASSPWREITMEAAFPRSNPTFPLTHIYLLVFTCPKCPLTHPMGLIS